MLEPEQRDKLAKACHSDQPGTMLDRWKALCIGGLFHALLGRGRDVTIVVGKRTDRKRGALAVVLAEERN